MFITASKPQNVDYKVVSSTDERYWFCYPETDNDIIINYNGNNIKGEISILPDDRLDCLPEKLIVYGDMYLCDLKMERLPDDLIVTGTLYHSNCSFPDDFVFPKNVAEVKNANDWMNSFDNVYL